LIGTGKGPKGGIVRKEACAEGCAYGMRRGGEGQSKEETGRESLETRRRKGPWRSKTPSGGITGGG